jgi:uncharacterized protein (TIGR03437 family)
VALILGSIPFVLYAYEYGPPPGNTGAPFDTKTGCISAQCHVGTVNSGPGNVKILLPNGTVPTTYTPGQSMQLLVQITDSTKKSYGFQMTARMGSGNLTQAGSFMPADNNTFVQCGDGTILQNPGYPGDEQNPGVGGGCPAISDNFQYIEHEFTGYTASLGGSGSFTYMIDWTPPTSGTVTLYVAANCGIGNPPVVQPTDVYLSNLTLTPAAAPPPGPTIDAGGIVPVDSSVNTIQPGSWISIYSTKAQNLAPTTTVWSGSTYFPTLLGGVSVKINNKLAYLWFVSPTQINLQAPDDTATGTVTVAVTNGTGTGTSTVALAPQAPAFLLLADGLHATGIIITPDGSGSQGGGTYDLLGPGPKSSTGMRPVNPGETVVLYGVGFGPTSPAVPAGQYYNGNGAPMAITPPVTVGSVPVQLTFSGIVAAGLYQFSFVVPSNVGSGDQALQAMVNGVTTPANVFVPVQ